jgi:diguanylate cyclase (GGDEF)-like protein
VRRLPAAAVPAVAALLALPTVVAPGTTVAQVTYTIAFGLIVVVAWLGVRSRSGPAVVAHAFMAAALTAWLAGDLLYSLLSWRSGDLGDVSAADALWILGYPLLAAGLVKMTRLRAPGGRLRDGLLDGLAMATVVAALFVQFMIRPAVSDGLTLAGLAGALYPFGDVLLFATAAILVLSPGDRRGSTRYLVAALTLTFLGDVGISALPAMVPGFDDGRLDGLLLLGNSLFAAALWHPRADRMTRARVGDDERLHPARVVFLGIALLALPALAGLRTAVAIDRVTLLGAMMALTVIILIRFTLVVRDQERVRRDLAHRATHDQLTGLVNRQELHVRLAGALRRRPAGSAGPVVHFLDLDGFKLITDAYGHAAGDFVLTEVAARIRAEVRPDDTVARLGGDEFVVLTEDADESLDERLRRAVSTPMRFEDNELSVGVSIGVARAATGETPTSDALLAAADAIMYREKTEDRLAAYRSRSPHPLS